MHSAFIAVLFVPRAQRFAFDFARTSALYGADVAYGATRHSSSASSTTQRTRAAMAERGTNTSAWYYDTR
eukprot:1306505-Rhodomonas_salina.1